MQIFGSLQLGPDHGDSGPTGCTCIRVGRQGIRTPNSFVLRDSGSTGWIGPLTWAVAEGSPPGRCLRGIMLPHGSSGQVRRAALRVEHPGRRGQPVHPAPPFVDPVAADPAVFRSGSPVGRPGCRVGRGLAVRTGSSPLPFIFSVDCAALPRADGFGLPAGGSLLFFLDHEQRRRHRGAGGTGESGTPARPAPILEAAAGSTDDAFVGEQYDVGATLRAEFPRLVRADRHEDEGDEDDLSALRAAVGPLTSRA